MNAPRHPISFIALTGALTLALTSSASAARIPVTTEADQSGEKPGRCSLREAIRSANTDTPVGGCRAGSGKDTVKAPAGHYKLTKMGSEAQAVSGSLDITADLIIHGAGANKTVIDGNRTKLDEPVFFVLGVPDGIDATFEGVTVTRGAPGIVGAGDVTVRKSVISKNLWTAESSGEVGAGISFFNSTLAVIRSKIVDNRMINNTGGGIANWGGTASIVRSTIADNRAEGDGGGGVSTLADAGTTVDHSRVIENQATGAGGGVRVSGGELIVTSSTIAGNYALAGGGGISSSGSLTLGRTTVSGNHSVTDGGGIRMLSATANIENSTVSGNEADANGGGIANGSLATTNLRSTTINRNIANFDNLGGGNGGGTSLSSGTIDLENTILAGNEDRDDPIRDCSGGIDSSGYNLVGTNSACFVPNPTDKVGSVDFPLDPKLGPLRDNGGATKTHALKLSSPAVDAGNPAPPGLSCPDSDQRGVARELALPCDIGAYEAIP